MNVVVYSTPTCGYCHQVKIFLSQKGVAFTEHDVSVDEAAAEEMVRKTGQMGVPVILIDDEVVVGFNRARLEQLLAGSGGGQHPHFGLQIADASKIAQKVGMVPVFGAFVGKVTPSSPGDKAGLRQGDIITEVNLHAISNAEDLEKVLAGFTAGNRVMLVFMRGKETLKSEIVL